MFDADDDDDYSDGSAMQQVRKHARALEKKLKELEAENASLRSSQRGQVVAEVLREKGISEKVAGLIPADRADRTSVEEWLGQYADLFGGAATAPQNPQAPAEPALSQADLAALRQMDAVQQTALPSEPARDTLSRLQQASSMEELMQIIQG
jgi:hypothetical protein